MEGSSTNIWISKNDFLKYENPRSNFIIFKNLNMYSSLQSDQMKLQKHLNFAEKYCHWRHLLKFNVTSITGTTSADKLLIQLHWETVTGVWCFETVGEMDDWMQNGNKYSQMMNIISYHL